MKTLTLCAAAVFAIVTTGCRSNDKMPSDSVAAVKGMAAPAPQKSPKINFGTEQNDTEGYGGLAWGSEPDTSQPESWEYGIDGVFDKAVGAPGRVGYIGAEEWVFFPSQETSPKMASYHPQDGGPYFVYFHGKLAWVSAEVNGDFQQVQADIERKYSTGQDVSANSWGDADSQQGVAVEDAYTGKLYKRGNTNTRIYLIQYSIHGQPMRSHLLYIPNAYLTAIHDEWWAAFRHAQQAAQQQQEDAAAKVRQSDQQKIQ